MPMSNGTSSNFIGTDFNAIADEFWWGKWDYMYMGDSADTDGYFEEVYFNTVEGKIQESLQNSDSLVIANYDYENQKSILI